MYSQSRTSASGFQGFGGSIANGSTAIVGGVVNNGAPGTGFATWGEYWGAGVGELIATGGKEFR
tara:strand:- start:531 stop:722 length:192 start_codon:yes stop_codon:yes gene_type:complete